MGSSIIRHASNQAYTRPDGIHLGLDRMGCSVYWHGIGGMRWHHVEPELHYLLKVACPPNILMIHCGGNDLGSVASGQLRYEIKQSIKRIMTMLPNTLLVWSQILPRKHWLRARSPNSVSKARVRINSAIATYTLANRGAYIKYPEICIESEGLWYKDGIHLSSLGNDLFLNCLQGALSYFITSDQSIFPPLEIVGPWLYPK